MNFLTLRFCFFVCFGFASWKEIGSVVPDTLNPAHLLFTNKCIEDLGCFYTGPPFYNRHSRQISLSPTSNLDVKFDLFTPDNPTHPYELLPTEDSLFKSSFNDQKKTKIVINGYTAQLDVDSFVFKMKDALLKEGGYNVIVVDWTALSGSPYPQAVANSRVVGALTAKLITFLMNNIGISPQSVHIIGHSLGAHLSGYAGERVPNLGRITGLDPAGPYFRNANPEVNLDTSDALFVDVIHTDEADIFLKGYGINKAIGHVDFYPNGNRRQPGCGNSSAVNPVIRSDKIDACQLMATSCNHGRAHEFFLESISSKNCRFLSVLCSSYHDFKQGKCPPHNSRIAEMGFHVKPVQGLTPPAKFFLRTKGSSPFCIKDSIYM